MEFDSSFVHPIERKGQMLGGYTFKMPSSTFMLIMMGLLFFVIVGVFRTSPESVWEFATYLGVTLTLLSVIMYLYFNNVQGTSIWVFQGYLRVHHGFRRRKIQIQRLYPRIALIKNDRDSDNPFVDFYIIHSEDHEILWHTHYLGDDFHEEQLAIIEEVINQLNKLLTEARQEALSSKQSAPGSNEQVTP